MSSTTPFTPSSPFDDANADAVLRSSDGSDFRVYRAVLSLASPFFKDMFSLPQPESDPNPPIIAVGEPAHTLDRLLRVWYPGADPLTVFEGVAELNEIIELALLKYDIQFLVPVLQSHLRPYLENRPVSVFAIACRYGWEDLARAAAKHCLKFTIQALYDEDAKPYLARIYANNYQELFRYHSACGLAASLARTGMRWNTQGAWGECPKCTDRNGNPTTDAWLISHAHRCRALLKERPGADLLDVSLLATSAATAVACGGKCASSGFQDLVKFQIEMYNPAVKRAVDLVPLELTF
ncbi:hypothetical protein C8R43DRAFT_1078076 [Mycena crocata]|nr:hypothetical protein C8R43DRAFT_1078076 [Mycena crocata]